MNTIWSQELKTSRLELLVVSFFYLIALPAIYELPIIFVLKIIFWLVVIILWYILVFKPFRKYGISKIKSLFYGDKKNDKWSWIDSNGHGGEGVLYSSVLLGMLVVLYIKNNAKTRAIFIWSDSLDQDAFRKLKVILGWIV